MLREFVGYELGGLAYQAHSISSLLIPGPVYNDIYIPSSSHSVF